MDDRRELDGLRQELDRWQERLDRLRVRANLSKMEVKEKLQEVGDLLEPACREATDRLAQITRTGVDEARSLARSLQAGWDALQRTHRDLAKEAERERKEESDRRRT